MNNNNRLLYVILLDSIATFAIGLAIIMAIGTAITGMLDQSHMAYAVSASNGGGGHGGAGGGPPS